MQIEIDINRIVRDTCVSEHEVEYVTQVLCNGCVDDSYFLEQRFEEYLKEYINKKLDDYNFGEDVNLEEREEN